MFNDNTSFFLLMGCQTKTAFSLVSFHSDSYSKLGAQKLLSKNKNSV